MKFGLKKQNVNSWLRVYFIYYFPRTNIFRATVQLATKENRPAQYDLTPTLIFKRTEEQLKQLEQDIKRAIELAPHKKPLERG